MTTRRKHHAALAALAIVALAAGVVGLRPPLARASTYAVYIPLDSSIYRELDTLNGLGLLDSYISYIKPISRVEAARLTIEAESNLDERSGNPLAHRLVHVLRAQLREEVSWLEKGQEDKLPTMVHPVERLEAQYVYSSGDRRQFTSGTGSGLNFREGTPLLPYNDNLDTAPGSNEVARWAGWAGLGGFITGYGEGAIAGPLSKNPNTVGRAQLLTGAAVVSLGNTAISFGQEEMTWGLGWSSQLAQSANAKPFPALRVQNIHPRHLPWIFRYLGLMRYQVVFGQLDAERVYARPWISAQVISFKPLPWFEWGMNHAIMFGGSGNANYSALGFLGRTTGFATGSSAVANTNSRFGMYGKFYIPQLRNTQVYSEILSEDFYAPLGHNTFLKMPFKSPSYTFGVYAPQLTADGLTDVGAEYTLLDSNYSTHSDSLYWTYQNALMGDALGPGGWHVNAKLGRWFDDENKLTAEFFFERRSDASFVPITFGIYNESGFGGAFDIFHLPFEIAPLGDSLGEVQARAAAEYVENINYSNHSSVRTMLQLTFALTPAWNSLQWK
ncbi:MAG TPA: capsule assembly Wzi family protein [Candidatus Binataceae bacterium]|nr:capsule assembly Wzi family protein [Candidatus Binataceae bacterium]